jgi:hypothetical protein
MRLHAILVRRNPPLVPEPACQVRAPPTNAFEAAATAVGSGSADTAAAGAAQPLQPVAPRPDIAALRAQALGLVRWALGGDAVAAEYVLLQLLGRVMARGDPAALGQLTMNLCRCG